MIIEREAAESHTVEIGRQPAERPQCPAIPRDCLLDQRGAQLSTYAAGIVTSDLLSYRGVR